MLITAAKTQLLEQAGYAYSFDRLSYINREAHKIFSVEFVQDHDEAEIRERINEATPIGEWRFYFNSPPSEAVRRDLANLLTQ